MPQSSERDEYIAGLRALADLLEARPDLCIPATGVGGCSSWSVMPKDRAAMQAWADVIESAKEKVSDNFVSIRGKIGPLEVSAFGSARNFGREITRERVTTEYEVEPFLPVAVQS